MSQVSRDIAGDVAELSAEQKELLELLMREEQLDASDPPIVRTAIDRGSLPLSFAQERLWFFDQLNPGSPVYNLFTGARVKGPLNPATLQQCFGEVVRRHEPLRATFATVEGQPAQVVKRAVPLALAYIDLSGLSAEEFEAQAQRLAIQEARRPFNLTRGPLLRVTLLGRSMREHVLLLTMHHIISDAWSMGLLADEVASHYQTFSTGVPSRLPDLSIQYSDFAAWQRSWLHGEVLESQLDYWQRQLAGASPVLALPTDRPRPAVQRFRGASQSFLVPAALTEGLKRLTQNYKATLFTTITAALQTLLHVYTNQNDISIGAPVVNRSRSELEELIGFFVNTLVLRTDFSDDPSFAELLGRVRETVFDAQAHQDVPFEKLVEVLQPERDLSHAPLFQVAFSLDNTPANVGTVPALSFSPFEIDTKNARLDLHLTIVETSKGLAGSLEYNSDLFDAATVERMIGHFQTLLAGVVANPGQRISELPLLSEGERHRLMVEWNETRREFAANRCAHELFEEQVSRTPDAVALLTENGHISYFELNRRANQLAHFLRQYGVGPEVKVAVSMRRSPEMIIAILGILKAGGAYVPIDPTYPSERLSFILEDASVPLVLTAGNLLENLLTFFAQKIYLDAEWDTISSQPSHNPAAVTTSDNLVYAIYTSGSTGGVPKAALLNHRGLCNLVAAQARAFGVRPGGRVLQFASASFDASVSEVFVTLAAGATLVLPTEESLLPGPPFLAWMREQAITAVTLPPSVLSVLPAGEVCTLEVVIAAGEECPADVVSRWSRGLRFLNAYGPTETTVCATIAECHDDGRRPSIGRPIDNTKLYLLNRHFKLVPIGVPGELYVDSIGLAWGYQGNPELTAQRFVPHPFGAEPGARLYRTGDLARYLPNGDVDFLGRVDRQVKIRGYRIELAEIEAALTTHRTVREAVVLARQDRLGEKQLIAYVVPHEGEECDIVELWRFLRGKLPTFMLPSELITLKSLPLTPNGKIDRRALPAAQQTGDENGESYDAPRTQLEEQLVNIWTEVLGVERVGIHDDFFELRGHSLSLIQVAFRVQETLGCELPLQIFFLAPTIEALAKEIESARAQA
jgi:amino acid adenylation domain-containing protein